VVLFEDGRAVTGTERLWSLARGQTDPRLRKRREEEAESLVASDGLVHVASDETYMVESRSVRCHRCPHLLDGFNEAYGSGISVSEEELDAELDLPRRLCAENAAEVGCERGAIGHVEVDAIEHVEDLEPEQRCRAGRQRDPFLNVDVDV